MREKGRVDGVWGAVFRNKPYCVQGTGNSGWCSRLVSSGCEPLLTGETGKMDGVEGRYVPRMSHSAWIETGRMDDMVGWCLPG